MCTQFRTIDTAGVPVLRVDKDSLTLKNGESHPFGLLVWSTGIGPIDLVRSLAVAKDRGGKVGLLGCFPVRCLHPLTSVVAGHAHPPTHAHTYTLGSTASGWHRIADQR